MNEFKGKRITVMGLGFHQGGEGVARFFAKRGAEVTVTDINPIEKMYGSVEALSDLPIRFVMGRHEERDFIDTDMVVRNPGVSHTSRFLQIAKDHGIPVEMESSLFFRLSPSRNIIAVTGTKGKSTTSTLAAYVCEKSGKKVHLMGNLVRSMLAELDFITPDSIVVLELSSYQCEGFAPFIGEFRSRGLGPLCSIFTNLYPDHLNRYSSMQEYAFAKKQLLLTQNGNQFSIINEENEWFNFFSKEIEPKVINYNSDSLPSSINLKLLGKHNRMNAGAIYLMAKHLGLDMEVVADALTKFSGIEHRLEHVRSIDGVDFYNDTTATNPSAAVSGIKSISELNRNIVLIAGGNDKEMDFDELVALINHYRIDVVMLEGTADRKLSGIDKELIVGKYNDYTLAIKSAYYKARTNGIVLLSPGATSFNMFRDEFDRGHQFKKIVNNL